MDDTLPKEPRRRPCDHRTKNPANRHHHTLKTPTDAALHVGTRESDLELRGTKSESSRSKVLNSSVCHYLQSAAPHACSVRRPDLLTYPIAKEHTQKIA